MADVHDLKCLSSTLPYRDDAVAGACCFCAAACRLLEAAIPARAISCSADREHGSCARANAWCCVMPCRQTDKRGPPGAVIEGKAKRYKLEDGTEANQQYTAAQVGRLGKTKQVNADPQLIVCRVHCRRSSVLAGRWVLASCCSCC
jgi:hypothetical protein